MAAGKEFKNSVRRDGDAAARGSGCDGSDSTDRHCGGDAATNSESRLCGDDGAVAKNSGGDGDGAAAMNSESLLCGVDGVTVTNSETLCGDDGVAATKSESLCGDDGDGAANSESLPCGADFELRRGVDKEPTDAPRACGSTRLSLASPQSSWTFSCSAGSYLATSAVMRLESEGRRSSESLARE